MASLSNAELAAQELASSPKDALPYMSENVKSPDVNQQFASKVLDVFACQDGHSSPLYLRTNGDALAIRCDNRWLQFHRGQRVEFWRAVMQAYPQVRESNWSIKRQQTLWDYFLHYAPAGEFNDRRYFETANCILDGKTGELDYSPTRFLDKPTVRHSPLAYDPEYIATPAWQEWHDGMDDHQRRVRQWSVGSAITGEYGLLMTFGQSRTGKSTLAEGLMQALGSGTSSFSLADKWNRFYLQLFDNTTYLYDPDSKGSKNQNNDNYETIHMMASGDPLAMEIKGGASYRSQNYGFMELISNTPVPITFEQSLVDRVRFCLYNYIHPRGDNGEMKGMILADKQAWLNYAIECAVAFRKEGRPPVDEYQVYGWMQWLKHSNSYSRICVEQRRMVTYSEYKQTNDVGAKYLLTRDSVETIQEGFKELNRQYGSNVLVVDWDAYGKQLEKEYYDKTTKLF